MIDDFEFDVGDRFTYEYNFFEHWIHDIRVEAIYENTELKTPFCISGHGMPGATVADEFDKTLAFLDAIVNADDETTIGEIRPFADSTNTRYKLTYQSKNFLCYEENSSGDYDTTFRDIDHKTKLLKKSKHKDNECNKNIAHCYSFLFDTE
ncbi:hypothetical protein FSJ07_022890 [Escherichia coli]|nr:hypothetical protein [Escherichia coli]